MGTGRERECEREQGWRSEGRHKMITRTGAGTETRAEAEMGTETTTGTGVAVACC